MTKLRFSDGIEFDTSGELRVEKRSDGLYVVGKGMLCAVKDLEDGRRMIDRLRQPMKD